MRKDTQHALVGISISQSPDLERLGFGKEHLAEFMMSVTRTVLRHDDAMGLVYGGDLRPGGFTERLFELALSEHSPPSPHAPEPPRRIYSYLAWPYYLALPKQDEARLINACHFMRIRPRDAGFSAIADDCEKDLQLEPPGTLVASRCLTRMRELATWGGHPTLEGDPAPPMRARIPAPPMRARILLGGRPSGYSSFMPGLFEEFLMSRVSPDGPSDERPPQPVFVIGGPRRAPRDSSPTPSWMQVARNP